MNKLVTITALVIILLFSGCYDMSKDNALIELADAQLENSNLKTELENKNSDLRKLEEKVSTLEDELQRVNQDKQCVYEVNTNTGYNDYNTILDESICLTSKEINFRNFSIQRINELFGKPNEVLEYEDAHSGLGVIELRYSDAVFIFNEVDGCEKLKWLKLLTEKLCTSKGITIGSSREEVIEVYDRGYYGFYSNDECISIGEKTGIRFDLDENLVTNIVIWFAYE